MGFFSKTEIVEVRLPFTIQQLEYEDIVETSDLGGLIDFEAYGRVGEELDNKYFYAMVGCHHILYNEFIETLSKNSGITLKISVKLKAGKAKSFKIDFKDLAEKLQDEKYEKLFMADDWISDQSRIQKLD